jgi:TfoX/Sxy family transcriptional regulator of competence genes
MSADPVVLSADRHGTTTLSISPIRRRPSLAPIAYDQALASRIRELLGAKRGLSEKRMFGGLAFLIHGNMAIAASGQGGLLIRVDPDESARLIRTTKAEAMVMRGKAMAGWLRMDEANVRTKRQLEPWVVRAVNYAGSLPKK